MKHPQDSVHEHSLQDPESFWSCHAQSLHWHQKPSKALERSSKHITLRGNQGAATHDHWNWFPDGMISTAYNCVDRHVENGNGDNVAIVWESAATGESSKLTYRQLKDEVEILAGVLREEGVRKGDVVIIYSMSFWIFLFFFLLGTRLR